MTLKTGSVTNWAELQRSHLLVVPLDALRGNQDDLCPSVMEYSYFLPIDWLHLPLDSIYQGETNSDIGR